MAGRAVDDYGVRGVSEEGPALVEHIDPWIFEVGRAWAEAVVEGRPSDWWMMTHPDLKLAVVQMALVDRFLQVNDRDKVEVEATAFRLADAGWEDDTDDRAVMQTVVQIVGAAIPDWWAEDWSVATGRHVSAEGLEIVSFLRPEQHPEGMVEADTLISIWPVLVAAGDPPLVRGVGSYWAPIPGWPPGTNEPVDVVDR